MSGDDEPCFVRRQSGIKIRQLWRIESGVVGESLVGRGTDKTVAEKKTVQKTAFKQMLFHKNPLELLDFCQ